MLGILNEDTVETLSRMASWFHLNCIKFRSGKILSRVKGSISNVCYRSRKGRDQHVHQAFGRLENMIAKWSHYVIRLTSRPEFATSWLSYVISPYLSFLSCERARRWGIYNRPCTGFLKSALLRPNLHINSSGFRCTIQWILTNTYTSI